MGQLLPFAGRSEPAEIDQSAMLAEATRPNPKEKTVHTFVWTVYGRAPETR